MTKSLPAFLRELLSSPPKAGEGVHPWLYRVSRQLHAHMSVPEIVSLLENCLANCGRPVPRSEILSAVENSKKCAWRPTGTPSPKPMPSWPSVNQERLEAVVRDNGGLADLWELSPVRLEDTDSHAEEIIDRLFPDNPLLCCGLSQTEFATKQREDWRGQLAGLQFIVPAPMTDIYGITQDGKQSQHTLHNTGERRFIVVECDFRILAKDGKTETKLAPMLKRLMADGLDLQDVCAAILIHLGHFAPLVCANHSGGSSIHGWYYVEGQPEDAVARFFRYAVSIGADKATWSRTQFVRVPDGMRDNGKRQTVFFLSLKPLCTARETIA